MNKPSLIDDLKSEESFDKYIIFLLGLGFSKTRIAKLTGVSRQTVYSTIQRNKKMLEYYCIDTPPNQ